MRITDIRINGKKEPIGFLMDSIRCAWKYEQAKEITNVKIEVAVDEEFHEIVYEKESEKLNSAGELLEFKLTPYTRYYIKVTAKDQGIEESSTTFFETAKEDSTWQADWITTEKGDTFHPVFEKEFVLEDEVKRARMYVSGLGLFEASLNCNKIGQEVLTPYYSNYKDEVQYITYDITEQLKEKNLLQISLGNGWYKGRFGLGPDRKENFGNTFQMIAELHIEYKNGNICMIKSDDTWNYTQSDVVASDIYDGEMLDRLCWHEKRIAKQACIFDKNEQLKEKLIARYSLPVYEMHDMKVKEIITTPLGETVLDFGQNFAGYVVFHAHAKKGETITLDFGEILQNGNFYNDNYRSAKAKYTYVSDGRTEWVKPIFTFYGFRYVKVSGWNQEMSLDDFIGKSLYSDMKQIGFMETGNQKVNQLISNVLWGQRSNSIDFPTDCPQRDERLGWTGDVQVFCETASYTMDTSAFYDKFIHDLMKEQDKLDGILPGVIPVFDPNEAVFSSVWGDIATFLPDVLYRHFADKSALKRYYPMMRNWVDKITREDCKRGQRYLYDFGDQLGDWLALDGRNPQSMQGGTDSYFIASCYYAMSVQKTASAAQELGYAQDEKRYHDLYENIRQAILKEYFTQTGRLSIDTQTGYIVSLFSGIYVEKERTVTDLKRRLYKDAYKIKGGFVGAPMMCKILAENGLEEEAFYFLLQEGFPGWMNCINLGATTVWERWNSVLQNGMISGTLMNSLNHYAFGSIMAFLYRDVAGLKALEPGFKKVEIAPQVNKDLKFMKLKYDSTYGTYRVEWNVEQNGDLHIIVEVPYDATAILKLPLLDQENASQESEILLGNGTYEYTYTPSINLFAKYSRKTLFQDMIADEQVMQIIEKMSPMLHHLLNDKDQDFLTETIDTLSNMAFLGFGEEFVEALWNEISKLTRD